MRRLAWLVLMGVGSLGAQEAPGPLDVQCVPPAKTGKNWNADSVRLHTPYHMNERDHRLLIESPETAPPGIRQARFNALNRRACVAVIGELYPSGIVNPINLIIRDSYRSWSVLFDRETPAERLQLAATRGPGMICSATISVALVGTFDGYESTTARTWRPVVTMPTVVALNLGIPTLDEGAWESYYPTPPQASVLRAKRNENVHWARTECDRTWTK